MTKYLFRKSEYSISVVFEDLPKSVIIDSSVETKLDEEYLLKINKQLEIKKAFNGSKCTNFCLNACHSTNTLCCDLHSKKISELKDIVKNNGIKCENNSICSLLRKSIWNHFKESLNLSEVLIDVNTGIDTKAIWSNLSKSSPLYSLFQLDRQNTDGDKEIQDPLKAAVSLFIQDAEIQQA